MRISVVGGGTATNVIAPVFPSVAFEIVYVVPISDNGGSTSEVLRVFGGPAIGDARSRLVRLMDPLSPLRTLLSLRLSDSPQVARDEWIQIVEGSHSVWTEVAPYMKAMYRAFLVEIHAELLKKFTPSSTLPFNFSRASIGNLLLTGARLYFGTLEAAIEFVLHTTRIPSHFSVVPCLDSSFAHHIAATLESGEVIVGQSAISHPSSAHAGDSPEDDEDDILPFSHPSLRKPQIMFAKDDAAQLPSPIHRLYYVNMYGDEIRPKLSNRVVTSLQTSDAVVFSVGSLYTSIIPVLLLQGFAASLPRLRVLILNGSVDRETEGMSLADQVWAINRALDYSLEKRTRRSTLSRRSTLTGGVESGPFGTPQFITGIVYPQGAEVSDFAKWNIKVVPAECPNGEYQLASLEAALKTCLEETGPTLVRLGDLEIA